MLLAIVWRVFGVTTWPAVELVRLRNPGGQKGALLLCDVTQQVINDGRQKQTSRAKWQRDLVGRAGQRVWWCNVQVSRRRPLRLGLLCWRGTMRPL